ncbi:hypothetical protein [Daejeonella sp. JGW-45]|uniref:hypothetical protein n=1 Tax=Daejeonella sp. JGW-45 TaxID=3034148 RepID=UPI0023EC1E8A|nr:hypothetical protein [Daejeonella sp. JGW-45]
MATKVNSERLKSTIASLKARFETNTITSMNDLTDMYITGLIAALGIGYDGFINKCAAPEKFVIEDLVKLSQIIDVDIDIIVKVVLKQAKKNVKSRDISHLLSS